MSRISNDFVLSEGGKKVDLLAQRHPGLEHHLRRHRSHANIGQRLKAVQPYLEGERMFLANYSDGLTDLPLPAAIDHFRAARTPSRASRALRPTRASTSSGSRRRTRRRASAT